MYVVIMAGGSGTRFWPLSRRHRPKQLLRFFGDRTMLAETVARFEGIVPPERILIVTGRHLAEAVHEAVPEVPRENVLLEPVGRNTAPCIGWAAVEVRRRTGDASTMVAVFPADHFIREADRFASDVRRAAAAASDGAIVTLGIAPTRPETGYGYIRHATIGPDGVAEVEAFVEKPDRERATAYLASGNHLWNAGMFFFRVDTILGEIARQLPGVARDLDAIAGMGGDYGPGSGFEERFAGIQSISIDYGVMEGAHRVRVVPTTFTWSDVGHWDAMPEVAESDADGNVTLNDVVAIDSRQSVLVGWPGRVLAVVGVEGLVVVDSEDAVLVIPRDRVQDVREVVEALKPRGGRLT